MSRLPSARFAAIGSSVLLLVACAPELPIGRFACSTDRDCPDGWSCAVESRGERRCYPASTDHGALSGTRNPHDSGEAVEPPAEDAEAGMSTPPSADAAEPHAPDASTQPPASGRGGSSAPPAAGSGGGAAAGTGGSTPAGAPAPPPTGECKEDAPDPTHGVFVSPSGATSDDCGTPQQPCSTVELGQMRAQAQKRELVYLDSGTYAEAVVLRAGVHLQGGYTRSQANWQRVCSADRATRARISSPTEVGLWAEFDGKAMLDTLSIQTLGQAPLNHSMYGVFARGTATRLALHDVRIIAANGGHGTQGKAGAMAAGRSGFCAMSDDGSAGTTEGAPGAGAEPGTFGELGYAAADGMSGGTGAAGKNGTIGASSCRDCYDACDVTTCKGNVVGQSCGMSGQSGCGGVGGPGGAGGTGGGSSFAIFAWGARVEVEGGLLQAGNGGTGAAGGAPGDGGSGSAGQAGTNGMSCTICLRSVIGPIIPPPIDKTLDPSAAAASDNVGSPVPIDGGIVAPACIASKGSGIGAAGGPGGAGARGGVGGGGAGGHSYGAFAGGEGRVDVSTGTLISIGRVGKSNGNGAPGEAAEIKIVN